MSLSNPIQRDTRERFVTVAPGQSVFGPFDFNIYDEEDVRVFSRANGNAPWVAVADLTVTLTGPAPSPFHVTKSGLATGLQLAVRGQRLHERVTDIIRAGLLSSQATEQQFDQISIILQELRRDADRAALVEALLGQIIELASSGPVQSVNGRAGLVSLVKTDVGLGNVDNTSDGNKPVSTAQAAAINARATPADVRAIIEAAADIGQRISATLVDDTLTLFGPLAADLIEAGAGIVFGVGTEGRTSISLARSFGVAQPGLSAGFDPAALGASAFLSTDRRSVFASGGPTIVGNHTGSPLLRFVQLAADTGGSKAAPALPWKRLIVAAAHLFAIDNDDDVWGIGPNTQGQLGLGDTNARTALTYIAGAGKCSDVIMPRIVRSADTTGVSTYFLRLDGTLWACGPNGAGQLGDGTTTQRNTPVRCGTLTNVTTVWAAAGNAANLAHVFAIAGGNLFAWGDGSSSVLGNGAATAVSTPFLSLSGVARVTSTLDNNGSVWVASAWAVMNDGTVRVIGSNAHGQLGDGSTTSRTAWLNIGLSGVADVVSAGGHAAATLFRMTDGTIRSVGYNLYGQTGNGNNTTPQTAIITPAGAFQTFVSAVYGVGQAGFASFFLLTSTGQVWACGRNGHGQLGDGSIVNRSLFQRVALPAGEVATGVLTGGQSGATSGESAIAITTQGGRIYFLGSNASGLMGASIAAALSVTRPVEPDYPI
jgi:alpha-tubulin suppressor-like RCC1 family protein